jgi:hypothetical protein
MLFFRALLLSTLFVSLYSQAEESSWQGALRDGSRIVIDPETNKVTRTWQGESNLLWDGVHQLDNGAVIIVRDGIVVRDQAILRIQQEQERQEFEEACLLLVRKVCGPRNECDGHPACDPARQLLGMEQEELHNSWSETIPESSKQCLEALGNEEYFEPCTKRTAGTPLSPCEKLQRRVCGEDSRCADVEACNAAGQLVKMEQEDRYSAPGEFTHAGKQCSEVLNDDGFFKTCQ